MSAPESKPRGVEPSDWPNWPDYIAARAQLGALLRCPCTWGSCGHCTQGNHAMCAWVRFPEGPHGTDAYQRDRTNTWLVNTKHIALAPVYAAGTHDWRCQCDRDGHPGMKPPKPVQLDLFGEVTA